MTADQPTEVCDIVVIGGGINGCGIARDAAGRGASVLLAERDDLASGTSSASTKLIHGGLRYLEHREFRLVRESLREREVLWAMAPHIVRPLRFVLPHHPGLRPAWLIRLGLFLYDHLGGRRLLPTSRTIDLSGDAAGALLKPSFARAFEYSDCWVDDARLVVLNAVDAARRGADIRVRTRVDAVVTDGPLWRVALHDAATGRRHAVSCRALVNAAGPWVAEVAGRVPGRAGQGEGRRVRLVKGSHIVVPRLFAHDRAYILQNADRRIVFAIPYEGDFTLIGTTDVDVPDVASPPAASPGEIAYLCETASAYFRKPVAPGDVVWSYAGVRPLHDEGSGAAAEATRDYVLDVRGDGEGQGPVLLNVFGGKITTYRRLAEEAVDRLAGALPDLSPAWTAGAPLPGGDFPVDGFAALVQSLCRARPGLDPAFLTRLARAYGTRAEALLGAAAAPADLGRHFGADLYEREVAYLVRHEWARSADDILWRRTKLGLRLSPTESCALGRWLDATSGG